MLGIAQQSAPCCWRVRACALGRVALVVVLMGICCASSTNARACCASRRPWWQATCCDFRTWAPTRREHGHAVLPFITPCAACRPLALDMLAVIREAVPPVEASITQPASFVPFAHGLFVGHLHLPHRVRVRVDVQLDRRQSQQTFFGLMPIVILLVMALLPKVPKADVRTRPRCSWWAGSSRWWCSSDARPAAWRSRTGCCTR